MEDLTNVVTNNNDNVSNTNDIQDTAKADVKDTDIKDTSDKKYTEEDFNKKFDKLLEKKYAEWKKKEESNIAEAIRKSKLSSDEKAKEEIEEIKRENERLKKAQLTIELGKAASSTLKEKGIVANEDILSFVVGDNQEQTEDRVAKFASIFEDLMKEKEAERAKGTTPNSYAGSSNTLDPFESKIKKYNDKLKK